MSKKSFDAVRAELDRLNALMRLKKSESDKAILAFAARSANPEWQKQHAENVAKANKDPKRIAKHSANVSGDKHAQFKGYFLGTNIKTGEQVLIAGLKEATAAGFLYPHISACALGRRKSHKGYTWQRLPVSDYVIQAVHLETGYSTYYSNTEEVKNAGYNITWVNDCMKGKVDQYKGYRWIKVERE